jgi:putative addiction module killer protein
MSKIKIEQTVYFNRWLNKLKNRRAKAIIETHIERLADDNFGVVRSVGQGVYEKKINYGQGYRLYYAQWGITWIVLLCGGDKSTQKEDINLAHELKKKGEYEKNNCC